MRRIFNLSGIASHVFHGLILAALLAAIPGCDPTSNYARLILTMSLARVGCGPVALAVQAAVGDQHSY